jgi:4-amino-4-deoxy-L-arabinose transferase-like glycosyltransferase
MNGVKRLEWLAWALLVAVQFALVAPFVTQPIHIDDAIYVDIARNALKMPWHPQDLPYIFEGRRVPDMGSHSHPPFVSYCIALFLWLFGDGPRLNVVLHVGFLIFPLLFAIGIYRLTLRFSASPPGAALVAIVSPAAVVASHTVMTDFPCLAMSTLGLALYVDGVDQQRSGKLWASAALLTAAAFSSYPSVLLFVACWVYAILKQSKMRGAFVAPLVAPVWMGAWLTYSSLHFGRFVLSGTAAYVARTGGLSSAGIMHKLLAFPIFLAGTLVLPLPLVRGAWNWLRRSAAVLWVVISVALTQRYAADYALRDRFLVALLLTLGGWILLGLFLRMWRACVTAPSRESRQDALFLTVWALIVIAQILLVYASGMARYLLPLLPPMVLLTFFKSSKDVVYFPRAIAWGVSVGVVVALALSAADFEMARVHRDIARHLGKAFAGWESQIRFGAEWGLRHYLMEQRFRQILSTGDDFAGGQFIVSPAQAVAYAVPQDVDSMLVPVRRESWSSSLPIRLMNRSRHAGFYSSAWGLLPFSLSRAPVEEITIEQVSFLSERLPEIGLEADKGEAIIPIPAPDGGVDIAIPVPSRITIPYDVALPVRVQFSCVAEQPLGKCPVHIAYVHDGVDSELQLQPAGDSAGSFYFELPGLSPSMIVLDTTKSAAGLRRLLIRNWFMLPSGGAK